MTMRDDLLTAGMRLFGEQGYAKTSVADIQTACGLTAGSGALYKHFSSKYELLAEGICRYVDELDKSRIDFVGVMPVEPRAALQAIASAVIAKIRDDSAIVRVSLRDLDPYPELLEELWAGITDSIYRGLAAWIVDRQIAGAVSAEDPDATAAVLMASLTYFPILRVLIDRTPGGLDLERYLRAWVDSALRTLAAEGVK